MTINKQSLRDEFDKIKAGLNEQIESGKVAPETATLINALLMLFSMIITIFLEKNTKKTSKNSSIPPSQTSKDDSSTGSGKSNGRGLKETTTKSGNTRTVETGIVLPVTSCQCCGEDLTDIKTSSIERRTRIDIIFEKTVEHWDAQTKDCPSCKSAQKASFPEGIAGPLQYGSGIKAYVISLLVSEMLSLNRAAKMMMTLIGQAISEATLLSYVKKLYLALEPWEKHAKEQLLKRACINTDETSLKVDGKNHWIHVYSAGDITLKCLHKKRGKEAIEDISIIPKYGGVIVHDCWRSYLGYEHCLHGLCGSHLLRELVFVYDSNQYRWAKNIKNLLQETCRAVSLSDKKCLDEDAYKTLQRRYRNILTRGQKEMPPIPTKSTGKRGKIAKSDAHNLWERLNKYESAVLLFAKMTEVPFTNNRAERDLRMTKVKQKISGCFRVLEYANAYCRISSYIQTMKYKGVNPMVAISQALNGSFDFLEG
jgi:transposase